MKNLIVFKSKHGTTRKLAMELRQRLGTDQTDLIDLAEKDVPDLSRYETILIGGSMHMGKIQKKVSKFMKSHLDLLLQKRIALFLCYMDMEHGKEEFERVFPAALREHSAANGLFGGEFLLEEMNFVDRLLIKKASGVTETSSKIDREAVEAFIALLK